MKHLLALGLIVLTCLGARAAIYPNSVTTNAGNTFNGDQVWAGNTFFSGPLVVTNNGGIVVGGVGLVNLTNGWVRAPQFLFSTNLVAALAPDFSVGYSIVSINTATTFAAPVNVSTTNDETTVTFVTNTTASVVALTCPTPGVATGQIKTNGVWNCTNLTAITWHHYARMFTNATALPLF